MTSSLMTTSLMPLLPGTSYMMSSIACDAHQRTLGELQLHPIHLEELLELLDQAVLRFGQDIDERFLVQLVECGEDRQPADELRDEAELEEVFRLHELEQLAELEFFLRLDVGAEPECSLSHAALNDLIEPDERAAANEQNVGGIDLQEILLGVLAAALGWNVR